MGQNTTQQNSDNSKEATKFLQNDFNQCFNHMRHYDDQIVGIFKFLATFYTTILGLGSGLYQFFKKESINLTYPLIIGLTVGFIFGGIMYYFILRNHFYFVHCTRYINEQRHSFLSFNPLGFQNETRMYTDKDKPEYFNWLSSHSCLMYSIALLNSFFLFLILYLLTANQYWSIISPILLFILHLLFAINYFKYKETKLNSNT